MEKGTIDPAADHNWKFVKFSENTKIVFRTADVAKDYIHENSHIEYIGA